MHVVSELMLLFFVVFRVRLLSVPRGQSVFFIPATTTNDILFEGFLYQINPLHYFLILILEKEPEFPFPMLSAKQGNYWYHFYNLFGMTRSLTGN